MWATAGFLSGSVVKNPSAMQETWVPSLGQEDPLEKEMQPVLIFLPGKSHEQRSLADHSPWGLKRVGQNVESKQQQQCGLQQLQTGKCP